MTRTLLSFLYADTFGFPVVFKRVFSLGQCRIRETRFYVRHFYFAVYTCSSVLMMWWSNF